MPHYHKFGWYYFLKYVVGFAGMIFLYSGFLKERTFSCICAAEARELARRKGKNTCDNYTRSNESCPTGGTTDARAKRDTYEQSRVPVDVEEKYTHTRPPRKRRKKVEETAPFSRNPRAKYTTIDDLQVYKSKLARSDSKIQVRRHKRHRPDCRRALTHQRCLNQSTSSLSLKNVACLEVDCEGNFNRRLFDAVARANLEVRNSFAKQEHLELKAFACLIVDQGLEPYFGMRTVANSSSSNRSSFQAEESPSSVDESEEEEIPFSEKLESPEYYKIRYRVPFRNCRKHCTDAASTSFASVRSRSGSVYFTASSRGKRLECKIHGHRYSNPSKNPERREYRRFRITEESEELDDGIVRNELMTVNRRNFGSRRVSRYTSRCN